MPEIMVQPHEHMTEEGGPKCDVSCKEVLELWH